MFPDYSPSLHHVSMTSQVLWLRFHLDKSRLYRFVLLSLLTLLSLQRLRVQRFSTFRYSYLYIYALRVPFEPVRLAAPVTPQGIS